MFEIIPNWHPIFVHFTVALLSLAVALFVVTPFLSGELQTQWVIVARWALWFGAGFMVLTGLTGLYAFNTVNHDTPSHIAMTEHRNWAIATMVTFLGLAVWSVIRVRATRRLGPTFAVFLVLSAALLASTAWHGGELVYRHGLGVMALPKADAHHHGEGEADHHDHDEGPAEHHDHDDDHEHSDGDGHSHGDDEHAYVDAPERNMVVRRE